MREDDKDACKAMIRQAMEDFKEYNRYNVAGYSERLLFLNGMLAVVEWMPFEAHRRLKMKKYCYEVMSKLLGI